MNHTHLLHHLLENAASGSPDAAALSYRGESLAYGELAEACRRFAGATAGSGMRRGDRVAIYMEKALRGRHCVLRNRLGGLHLRSDQSAPQARAGGLYPSRLQRTPVADHTGAVRGARPVLAACPELHQVVVTPGLDDEHASAGPQRRYGWDAFNDLAGAPLHRVIDSDVAAILYTSAAPASQRRCAFAPKHGHRRQERCELPGESGR